MKSKNKENQAIDIALSLMPDDKKNKALKTAIRLHDFILSNAGGNEDWPLQISSSEKDVIIYLHKLLKDFRESIDIDND